MTENSIWFFLLLLGSVVMVVSYQWGCRRNIRLMREVSRLLEHALSPSDKEYTLLGGVAGFRAEYRRRPFTKIILLLSLLPRQSLLYMPVAWLRRGSDTLEMLFYLEGGVPAEAHIIRRFALKHWMPEIKNPSELQTRQLKREGMEFNILSSGNRKLEGLLMRLLSLLGPENTIHISLTPENNVLYVKLRMVPSRTGSLERAIKKALRRIERGLNLNGR